MNRPYGLRYPVVGGGTLTPRNITHFADIAGETPQAARIRPYDNPSVTLRVPPPFTQGRLWLINVSIFLDKLEFDYLQW